MHTGNGVVLAQRRRKRRNEAIVDVRLRSVYVYSERGRKERTRNKGKRG